MTECLYCILSNVQATSQTEGMGLKGAVEDAHHVLLSRVVGFPEPLPPAPTSSMSGDKADHFQSVSHPCCSSDRPDRAAYSPDSSPLLDWKNWPEPRQRALYRKVGNWLIMFSIIMFGIGFLISCVIVAIMAVFP
jgi:hypothetical protein